jgi:hypothetical protein
MDAPKWDAYATVVTYALDNGTVNDEIVKAVLAMTEMRDEAGLNLDAAKLMLLQVRATRPRQTFHRRRLELRSHRCR